MHCWLNMSITVPERKRALQLIDLLFTDTAERSPLYPKDALDIAVRTITVEKLTQSIKQALLDGTMVDDALCAELRAFVPFVLEKRDFCQHLHTEGVADAVATALMRQSKSGVAHTAQIFQLGSPMIFT